MDGYKASMETCLKQSCAKLQSFNKRISFASGRMELLQGLRQRCRHVYTASVSWNHKQK